MHVRVKRHKTTVFLNVDPTDTVDMMKEALAEKMQEVRGPWVRWDWEPLATIRSSPQLHRCHPDHDPLSQDASRQQLYRGDVALIGSKTVAECGIESDAVLALVLKQAGTA